MTVATAVIAIVLGAGTTQGLQQPGGVPLSTSEAQVQTARSGSEQAASGIIITADVEGRVAIYDSRRQLVVELNKPAGRQLQVALDPGAYEARLGSHPSKRARFEIADGQRTLLARANFNTPDAEMGGAPGHTHGHGESHYALDGRHRIEVRFGGWGDGWYDEHGGDFRYSGSAQAAFGLEYLNFVRNDLGVGLAFTTLASANGGWHEWEDGGAGRALFSIPVVARWYPVRRLTHVRSVEPYVTAGIGPVFAADGVYVHDDQVHGWDHDYVSSGHVGAAFGGRIGGGVDFRLGHVFTVGVGGAWNWDTGFHGDAWNGARPGGGEFTVAFGWNFGR